MRFGKVSLAAIAAASLIGAPIAAQAATGKSAKAQRAVATKQESKLGKGSGTIVAILAAIAVIAGVVIAAGNNNDTPTSP